MAFLNLADALLFEHLRMGHGNRLAVATARGAWTYAALAARVNSYARALRVSGVRPGDRVLLRLHNDDSFVSAWLATQKVGAVTVASAPGLRVREFGALLDDARPTVCVVAADRFEEVDHALQSLPCRAVLVPVRAGGQSHAETTVDDLAAMAGSEADTVEVRLAEDPAVLSYTSDTSPRAVGLYHTGPQLLASCDAYARGVLRASQSDVFGGPLPMWFSYGLGSALVFPLRLGATTILATGFNADTLLHAIQQHKISLLFCTATAYRLLLQVEGFEARFDLRSLRVAISSAEHLDGSTFVEWTRRTKCELLNGLGTTDTFGTFLSERPGEAVPGSLGKAVPGYHLRLINEIDSTDGVTGVLTVTGPTLGREWRSTSRLPADRTERWSSTGDLVTRDPDDRYWFRGRSDDLIVSAGYNISPAEVEAVLLSHPAVAGVVVARVPDPIRGAVPKAFIEWKTGVVGGDPALTAVREYAQRELVGYKCPRHYEEVSVLPQRRARNANLETA